MNSIISNERILAHRGLWKKNSEKNNLNSLIKALEKGFGIETDIRDFHSNIIISHDPPQKNSESFYLESLLEYYCINKCNSFLALNIKSDGLGEELIKLINSYEINRYFIFDMSIPELIKNKKYKLNQFCRSSEFEDPKKLLIYSQGVWVDKFNGLSYKIEELKQTIEAFPCAAIVSPELHGSSIMQSKIDWQTIKQICTSNESEKPIYLCTDFPEDSYEFFNG